jgi:hypothetical protein
VPHPFDSLRTGSRIQTPALERLVKAGLVDILEVLNARSIDPEDNKKALAYALEHDLVMSAGSDAHSLMEVGRVYAEVPPFDGAEQFLEALRHGTIHGSESSKFIHITSTWAKVAKAIPVVGERFKWHNSNRTA